MDEVFCGLVARMAAAEFGCVGVERVSSPKSFEIVDVGTGVVSRVSRLKSASAPKTELRYSPGAMVLELGSREVMRVPFEDLPKYLTADFKLQRADRWLLSARLESGV